jgi:hypothetical protein
LFLSGENRAVIKASFTQRRKETKDRKAQRVEPLLRAFGFSLLCAFA